MKLYLKKDTSDVNSRFVVLDELCKEKYYVVQSAGYNFHNLDIIDLGFNRVCKIRTMPLPLVYSHTITDKNDAIRLLVSKSYNRPLAYYYGISWRIRGNLILKNYEIVDNDNTVLLSHFNRWSMNEKGYELNVEDESRELLLIASAVCIDRIETGDKKQLLTV